MHARKRTSILRSSWAFAILLATGAAAPAAVLAQDAEPRVDEEYARLIAEYTTDARFSSPLVDHLPVADGVPSPLDHFGTIIGAPEILHTTEEIHGYMRALAQASRRVGIRSIGRTEEDREMIEVVIADEATIENLEPYRAALARLSDPRGLSGPEADDVIAGAKPIYYFTAGLHSPETGPPEMVMELAYRLAVGESDFIRTIRDNVITVIVPVTEPDGRDRMVDIYRYRKANNDVGPALRYWGKYVAHDNNRDGYGLGLALTRNILDAYLHWKPTVMHDLHESGYFLYTSTGTGPYNEQLDALTIDEWHNLAHEEVTELTKFGMPGVWTHSFYTGWAANYLIWIANTHNSIGRFYETLGNGGADTRERELPERTTSREWYRPNPPLAKVTWSLRNNTNYMQSGTLVALKHVADHPAEYLESFWLRGVRAVERGRDEAPHAWVIPADQRRGIATAELVNLLMRQGIEVHVAEEALFADADPDADADADGGAEAAEEETAEPLVPAGAYVVRLDQPYRTLVQILLDEQNFPDNADPPYDDTGWTLPYLHHVDAHTVDDPAVLAMRLRPLAAPVDLVGDVDSPAGAFFVVDQTTDDAVATLRFRLSDIAIEGAEAEFEAGGRSFSAGSLIIARAGNPSDLVQRLEAEARDLGLMVHGLESRPAVATHPLDLPRVGLVHTWVTTPQDAGWWRLAFDRAGIPYTHLSEQDFAGGLDAYDVLIMPNHRASPQELVAGNSQAGPAIPWERSETTPSLGRIASTDDMRRGMGFEGLAALERFLEGGGVFIVEGNATALAIDMGFTRRVSVERTPNLFARGSVLQTEIVDAASPIVYGYPQSFASYFNQSPVFDVDDDVNSTAVPDWLEDEIWATEVPRVVARFAENDIRRSGVLRGGSALAGAPTVIDVPVGDGHVVLFATRPFWRLETTGSHALVFNTLLHWNDLRTGWPERPTEDEDALAEQDHH